MRRATCLIDFNGTYCYPTTLGGTLCFSDHEDFWIPCEVALSVAERMSDHDGWDENDVLRAQLWVADAEGVVWTASHLFYAESLCWRILLSAQYQRSMLPAPDDPAGKPKRGAALFFSEEAMLVEDVHVFTDARGYYSFAVHRPSGEWTVETFRPKYLKLKIDIAAHPPSGSPPTNEWLALRFREWHHEDREEAPPIVCSSVPITDLFEMPGVRFVEGRGYLDEFLPQPVSLTFAPTEERGTPVGGVRAMPAPAE